MSMIPTSRVAERRQLLIRRIGIIASVLMAVLVLTVFGLVLRSESAHDESSCPFARASERTLGEVIVIEESRNCVPEAEEHRWLVQRPRQKAVKLGRKRLPKERFSAARTKWKVSEDKSKQVVLEIEVDGRPFSAFHEIDMPRD